MRRARAAAPGRAAAGPAPSTPAAAPRCPTTGTPRGSSSAAGSLLPTRAPASRRRPATSSRAGRRRRCARAAACRVAEDRARPGSSVARRSSGAAVGDRLLPPQHPRGHPREHRRRRAVELRLGRPVEDQRRAAARASIAAEPAHRVAKRCNCAQTADGQHRAPRNPSRGELARPAARRSKNTSSNSNGPSAGPVQDALQHRLGAAERLRPGHGHEHAHAVPTAFTAPPPPSARRVHNGRTCYRWGRRSRRPQPAQERHHGRLQHAR